MVTAAIYVRPAYGSRSTPPGEAMPSRVDSRNDHIACQRNDSLCQRLVVIFPVLHLALVYQCSAVAPRGSEVSSGIRLQNQLVQR